MILQGDICRLRSVDSSDIDTILLWENDPALARFSTPHPPYTREQIEQFVRNQQEGFFANGQIRWMVEVEGHRVGAIDLFDYNGTEAEVGILIYKECDRRKGYASDALRAVQSYAQSLRILRLKAVIDDDNTASIALFKGCGFVKTDNYYYFCAI